MMTFFNRYRELVRNVTLSLGSTSVTNVGFMMMKIKDNFIVRDVVSAGYTLLFYDNCLKFWTLHSLHF